MEGDYIVYVETDEAGCITAINSSAFLPDQSGWTAIDRGEGDRYRHAQGHYLPQPLFDGNGQKNWRLDSGIPVLRTDAEKAMDELPDPPAPFEPTADELARLSMRMEEFDQSMEMLLLGVTGDD